MNTKTAGMVWILTAITVIVGTAWYQAHGQVRQLHLSVLAPIAVLLKENQEILQTLRTDSEDSGILASYLGKLRADGVARHADMKQRLDRLAENNSAILALINVYKPHAKTTVFNVEAEKFQHYAIAWRDRWNSVMELFMAGGNYPTAQVPFPAEFAGAIDAESSAAKMDWSF